MKTKEINHEDLRIAFKNYLETKQEEQNSTIYGYAAAYGGLSALMTMVLMNGYAAEDVLKMLNKKD